MRKSDGSVKKRSVIKENSWDSRFRFVHAGRTAYCVLRIDRHPCAIRNTKYVAASPPNLLDGTHTMIHIHHNLSRDDDALGIVRAEGLAVDRAPPGFEATLAAVLAARR